MKVPRGWWFCAAIVTAAGCTYTGEAPSPGAIESGNATPVATSRASGASPRVTSAGPSPSRATAVDWKTLCVVAPLEGIDDDPIVKAPDTAWDRDGLVITNTDGDLVATWQGHDYPIFDGDVEQANDPAHAMCSQARCKRTNAGCCLLQQTLLRLVLHGGCTSGTSKTPPNRQE